MFPTNDPQTVARIAQLHQDAIKAAFPRRRFRREPEVAAAVRRDAATVPVPPRRPETTAGTVRVPEQRADREELARR